MISHFRLHRTIYTPSAVRAGSTLSEVLVSTLIMSIGIVSVATLFPISVMRSIQATQLTHAALLCKNVESRLSFDANMIHDPDRDGDEIEHRSDLDLNADGDVADTGEQSRGFDWLGDGIPDSGGYLIDPLGFATATADGLPLTQINQLGLLPRFLGFTGSQTLATARDLCQLPDSWLPILDTKVTAINTTTGVVSVTPGTDLSALGTGQLRNVANPNNPRYRMVLIGANGDSIVTRDLFQTGVDQLIWENTDTTRRPWPTSVTATSLVKVRVEVQDPRYTWLLTVRKNAEGAASVDAAIFFERSFRRQDQFVFGDLVTNPGTTVEYSIDGRTGQPRTGAFGTGYDGQPGVELVDDDQNGTTDDASERGWAGSDDKRTITANWPAGTDPPFLKRGGFVLDVAAGNWYRIIKYDQDTSPVKILVDRDLTPLPSNLTPRLVFTRGVVEVYPLGMRMAP